MPAGQLPSTIAAPVDHEAVIKKSRFLTHIAPVSTIAEADSVIASVRKQYWDAGHHCVAMIVGPHADQQRSSDDGEPAGTAGVPMLSVLRRRDVTDVVAIVTRYFGGILLGAAGLARAYSSSVTAALDSAVPVRRAEMAAVNIDIPHSNAGRVEHSLRNWARTTGSLVSEPTYDTLVHFILRVPPDLLKSLADELAAVSPETKPDVGATQIVNLTV